MSPGWVCAVFSCGCTGAMGSPGGDVRREVPFSPITPGAPAADLDLTSWLLYGGGRGSFPCTLSSWEVSLCAALTQGGPGVSLSSHSPKGPGTAAGHQVCRKPGPLGR